MKETKCYYATAHCFVRNDAGCFPDPNLHRYFLFTNFDEDTIQLVNETSLRGNWRFINGNRERFSFDRLSVSNGRELSDLTVYSGQVYKRIPARKTFVINQTEFLEQFELLELSKRSRMA
jgi:hypothetical protein